jgi:hypothetical protein
MSHVSRRASAAIFVSVVDVGNLRALALPAHVVLLTCISRRSMLPVSLLPVRAHKADVQFSERAL